MQLSAQSFGLTKQGQIDKINKTFSNMNAYVMNIF